MASIKFLTRMHCKREGNLQRGIARITRDVFRFLDRLAFQCNCGASTHFLPNPLDKHGRRTWRMVHGGSSRPGGRKWRRTR